MVDGDAPRLVELAGAAAALAERRDELAVLRELLDPVVLGVHDQRFSSASKAMPDGRLSWPGPVPCSPQCPRNSPSRLNAEIRWVPSSETYRFSSPSQDQLDRPHQLARARCRRR